MDSSSRVAVRNAADPEQVKRASRKDRDRIVESREALRAVMQTAAGRVVMWDLLARCKVFESIYESSSKIYYNAGRQDFGHELMALLLDLDDGRLYVQMEAEARARATRELRGNEAAHTARAGDTEGS